jgi:hypothetical protein
VAVGGVTAALFVFKAVFHIDVFEGLTGISTISNTIEGYNGTFGIWLVVLFTLSAGQLVKKTAGVLANILYGVVAVVSLVGLILLSFKIIWGVMLGALILLLLLGIGFIREARLSALSVLFALLILVIIFIIFDTPRSFQYVLPIETILSFKSSWTIASQTLVSNAKNVFLGSGPATFTADFSQFRSKDFNLDPLAWTIRFNAPFSTFFALLGEGGLISIIILAFIVVAFIGQSLSGWLRIRLEGGVSSIAAMIEKTRGLIVHWETFLTIIAWLVLTGGMFVIFYGPGFGFGDLHRVNETFERLNGAGQRSRFGELHLLGNAVRFVQQTFHQQHRVVHPLPGVLFLHSLGQNLYVLLNNGKRSFFAGGGGGVRGQRGQFFRAFLNLFGTKRGISGRLRRDRLEIFHIDHDRLRLEKRLSDGMVIVPYGFFHFRGFHEPPVMIENLN